MKNSHTLNPDDFVIVRRRKKYRFARFANSSLCFEYDEWTKRSVDSIEVGAGTAFFSVELAKLYPGKTFVAVDVKADRLQRGAYEAEACGLSNIFFIRARADQLPELFTPSSLEAIWVTFPDPFPKKGSAGRRLLHPIYLQKYRSLLLASGTLRFKTDARELFLWSLEQLVKQKWYLTELSFDLHDSELADEYKIKTSYEIKWLEQGIVTNFVSARVLDTEIS